MRIRHRKICLSCGSDLFKLVNDAKNTKIWACPWCQLMFGYKRSGLTWWYSGLSSLSLVSKGCLLVVPEVPVDALGVIRYGLGASNSLERRMEGLRWRL